MAQQLMQRSAKKAVDDQVIALGRLKTRCRISGTGTLGTAILLHPLGLDRCAFDALRCHIDIGWKLLTYDQYGHGSAAEQADFTLEDCVHAAARLVAVQSDAAVHLVGFSFGGAIAALVASRHTAQIASLTLLATPPTALPVFTQRADIVQQRGVQALIPSTLERWFASEQPALRVDDDVLRYAESALRNTAGLGRAWSAFACFQGYEPLRGTLPKTLCIAGACDLSTPPEMLAQIVRTLAPQAVAFAVVPGAGHMLALTKPAMVATLLQKHWENAFNNTWGVTLNS